MPNTSSENSFSGICKTIEPYPWNERIHNSQGGENDTCKFYCTTYATAFGCTPSNHNNDATHFTPRTGTGPDSGWTHEHVSQPHVVNYQLRREISTAETDAPTAQQHATTHAASYMQPNIHPHRAFINDVYTGNNRAFYPDISRESLAKDPEARNATNTEYTSTISTTPLKYWMGTPLLLANQPFSDNQSAFRKGNAFHNFFVSPEIMENDPNVGPLFPTTVYQNSFSGKKQLQAGTQLETAPRAGKRIRFDDRTQYDGFQSAMQQQGELQNEVDPTTPSRTWETQNGATYNWNGWREKEDSRNVTRAFGPPPTQTSGSTQNQSFLDVTTHRP